MIVFFVALYVGGTIMFKTYVSPHIGGLELNDAIALAANVLSGQEAETTYAEEDLDSFYSGLSEAMFLSEKSEEELEYELVPEAKRATLAPAATAAAGEDDAVAYDEDAAYAAFLLLSKAGRYALLTDETKGKISLAEYSALAGSSDAAKASRDKVGLKTYRISLESLLSGIDIGAEDFSPETVLNKGLSSLDFNFDTLVNYDVDDPTAQANEKFMTFSVNGKQVSAFINDVLTFFLSGPNSPLTSMLKENLPIDVDLTQYFKVSSVTIMNTPLVTKDGEALYDQKDTALGVSISINLRDLVAAALETDELKKQLDGVPSFAVDLIPNLVPKHFSAHATVYPLAPAEDQREVTLTINKPSEKNSQRLSTLLNAILGNGSESESESASETFLGNINNQVSAAFSSVNEVVKINFVPSKDKEGNPLKDDAGNTYSEMKIMTWDTVLSLIDEEGRLSAHDVFTMLKCLYISTDRPSEISVDEAFADFKSDMSSKYGVSSTYLEEHSLLSSEDLGGIIENINLSTLDFTKTNNQMQVRLSAEALAAFIKGMVTDVEGELASAEEEEGGFDPSTMLQGLDPKVCGIEIKKLSDKDGVKIYSFELIFSADLAEMVRTQLPSDGIAGDLARKLLPKKSSYFGIKIYLSEYTEDGKVLHKVGKNIDGAEDGATSLYASKLRINDFSYEETDRAIASLSAFMEVLSGSEEGFSLSSVTDTIEDAITSIFDSLAENDFNMTLRLYESDGANKGGVYLPSIYEMITALVSLNGSEEETFTTEDAREVLWLMYNKQVSMEETFTQGQAQTFLDEVNDKFYITKDNALAAGDLFGDGASNLSEKIKPDAIYFKPTATEAGKWTGEKKALYTDTRSAADLRTSLTGSELAAIIDGSNLIPSDVASSFGGIKMLGASFKTTGGKTYLNFDIKLLLGELMSGEGDVSKYSNLFPANIKLTTKILLYASSYTEAEPQYHSEVIINEDESGKVFMLMRALGGADMGETAIAETLSETISAIFTPLNENKVPLLYYQNAGAAYTSGDEECIKIVDVFTFLAGATEMTDISGDATDPDALAARLRGFGKQVKTDSNNEGNYEWMGDLLNLFLSTDDDYVYTNMQRAYFLNEAPSMDEVYNFSAKFETIGEDFNLKGENGLFYYDGDVKNLKVSDKALAVILKEKQASAFASAVSGEGMTVEIVSLKIYHENTKLVLESGVKIAFDGRDAYKMMPDYFFVIAKTVEDDGDPSGYVTTVSMNTLSAADTSEIFQNIASLAMNASSFNKSTIESKINEAISGALGTFPSSVTFGEFTSADVTNEYNKDTYENIRVAAGDSYLSFPSVYSFLIDIFYGAEEIKPSEKQMQHMLNSLHAGDAAVAGALVTNTLNEDSYQKAAFKGANPLSDSMVISSDRYLAYQINSRFSSVSIASGKLSLADALQQLIVLRGLDAEEEHDVRTYWEGKVTFAEGSGYTKSHDVMIATAKLNLGSYGTGEKISLLPENLWLTVFADMTSTDDSEGLLYDMNAKDTEIFVHVLSKYNEDFSVKTISKQFTEAITDQLNDYASGLTVSYKLATDDFYYYDSLAAAADVANRKNVKEDDDPAMDGVGYVVIATTAV